jgi:quercetin dioxygenase-like cupin family protein
MKDSSLGRAKRYALDLYVIAISSTLLAAGGIGSLARAGDEAQDALAGRVERREVQRSPSSIPGRIIVQVETIIPPGVESGWHTHPGEEVGYIVAGEVEMRVAGQPLVVLRAGDGFIIPPNTPHNARDIGPASGRMLSTYIVEPGQPIARFSEGIKRQ